MYYSAIHLFRFCIVQIEVLDIQFMYITMSMSQMKFRNLQPGKQRHVVRVNPLKVITFRSFSDFLLFARRNAGQPKHLIQLGGYQIR